MEVWKFLVTRILEEETVNLRKCLVGKKVKDVECSHSDSGDSYIKISTDRGSVIIGANDLGVWIASEEDMKAE